jgi:hypothetical protein
VAILKYNLIGVAFFFPFYASLLDPIGLGLPWPTSCLGLLQSIIVGLVTIATVSTPPHARPLCQPCAAPRRPHRPRGPSPPPEPDSTSTWSLERRTKGKFPHRRPNLIRGESFSNGFKSLRDRILSTYVIYLQENPYIWSCPGPVVHKNGSSSS